MTPTTDLETFARQWATWISNGRPENGYERFAAMLRESRIAGLREAQGLVIQYTGQAREAIEKRIGEVEMEHGAERTGVWELALKARTAIDSALKGTSP